MKRMPWQVRFVRPVIRGPGQLLLRREVPDVVEVTLPLYSPDDDARALVEREPVAADVVPNFINEPGTITVRLTEREMEHIAQAYLQARMERAMDLDLQAAGLSR